MAIESFRHRGLRELFETGATRRLDARLQRKIRVILAVLDSAALLTDAASLTGFHTLVGDLAGYHSVTVTGNRRIIFRFVEGSAFDVDYIDYH